LSDGFDVEEWQLLAAWMSVHYLGTVDKYRDFREAATTIMGESDV
jgi:hypothetical protein